ncbi:hypothetical protein HRbin36_02316 [bacterium HR36]|nr:hypothetical protein HRbin36_02316 [bacterium HR36]
MYGDSQLPQGLHHHMRAPLHGAHQDSYIAVLRRPKRLKLPVPNLSPSYPLTNALRG